MLGDNTAVCTTPMCDSGSASVSQMDALYQQLGQPSQYQQAHDAIMASYNQSYSWYSDLIPFNPDCCTLQQIGQQADALSSQMSGGTIGAGPSTQGQGMSLTTILVLGAALYLGMVYFASH
jgi:hypothetical protein